eukprot:788483_1
MPKGKALKKCHQNQSVLGRMLAAVFGKKDQNEIKKYENQFKQYNDRITIKHVEGYNPKDWAGYITRVSERYGIPTECKDDMIDEMIGAEKSTQITHNFYCNKGTGNFSIGRFAAIKRKDNKIDFAMWFFYCDYEMPPIKVVQHKKKKLSLGKGKGYISYEPVHLKKKK